MIALAFDVTVGQGEFTLQARDDAEVQVLGLAGPSGAGKTTLLEALAGLRTATGTIRVGDRVLLDSAAGIDVPPRQRRVGYVPQDALLFPHLTVRGNLEYGARDRRRVDAVAEMLEVANLVERPTAGLSGGERQRVALGRALAAEPELLLLDEPLGALDPARRDRILPYVLRARQALGVAMVWVTHDVQELQHAADRALVVDRGRVVHAGSVAGAVALITARPGY
ncbi:MAG: ATP-binding cassette domain-containing protein [Vicinamibacterales bacterium]